MAEYAKVEARIVEAIDSVAGREKFTVAKLAKEFDVPEQRLRNRLKGTPSKMGRVSGNRKLSEAQELGLRLFLDRVGKQGSCVPQPTIRNAANVILSRWHEGDDPPPVVGPSWVHRFLERRPEYAVPKQKVKEGDEVEEADNMDDADDDADEPQRPVTPAEQTDMNNCASTPYTVRSMKRLSDDILAVPMAPSLRYRLEKLMKGSLAQATAGVIFEAELERAKAAEPAQPTGQNPRHREVGTGGAIYVHEIRAIIAKRRLEEEKKKKKRARAKEARKAATQKRQQDQRGPTTSGATAQQ